MLLVPLLNPKFANTLAARPCELRVRGTSGVMVHLSRAMVQYMPLGHACRRSRKRARGASRGGMVKKIAVEEHFLAPGFEDYWAPTVVDLPAQRREGFFQCLTNFGEARLSAMDRAGIERCVLSLTGP